MSLPDAPAPFGAYLGRGVGRSLLHARRRTHVVSIALHLGLLVAGLAYSVRPRPVPSPPAVSVSLVLPRFAPPPPPAGGPVPAPAPVKKVVRPAAVVTPAPVPTSAPAAPAPVQEEAGAGGEGVEAEGVAGGEAGGVPGGTVGAPPPPPPPPAVPRKALLDRYLREVVRGRIAAQFHYPPEAEALALEGTVVMRLTIDHAGTLLAAAEVGGCPHDLLCQAARRTARAAAPFPPPPPELAGNVEVDVPLTYRLD